MQVKLSLKCKNGEISTKQNQDKSELKSERYMHGSENTRILHDLMLLTEEQNIPGLLLLVDFEKTFDTLSRLFINKVLIKLSSTFANFGLSVNYWKSL